MRDSECDYYEEYEPEKWSYDWFVKNNIPMNETHLLLPDPIDSEYSKRQKQLDESVMRIAEEINEKIIKRFPTPPPGEPDPADSSDHAYNATKERQEFELE